MSSNATSRMSTPEFVALTALLFSTIAFSVDIFLPAFPQIAKDFDAAGNVHLMITVFMVGLALGTLIAGPLSDAIGRRNGLFIGIGLYISSGIAAWLSSSFEVVLVARFFQGLGAAGPRVISTAVVRDLYEGRRMAQIISFAMILFALVPTFAPALGAALTWAFGWRSMLIALVAFMLVGLVWVAVRLNESLPLDKRRPLSVGQINSALREVFAHPVVRLAIIAQCAALSLIMILIVQVQQIYEQVFDLAATFPYWFGGVALISAVSTSVANAFLVVKLGMQRMIFIGMAGQALSALCAFLALRFVPEFQFTAFLVWQFLTIWLTGLTIGNLNALALEPMGHIAGFATSIMGFVSTAGAALIATLVGWMFDGTAFPLLIEAFVISGVGLLAIMRVKHVSE